MYKAISVLYTIYNDLYTISEQIRNLKDITTISGENLKLWAADYGIIDGGLTDEELRIRLLAKISTKYNGVTIPGIISTLSNFVDPLSDLMLTERSTDALGILWNGTYNWDGSKTWSGAGAIRYRAFDISLDFTTGISDPVVGAAVDKMKDYLKPAGILATIEYF